MFRLIESINREFLGKYGRIALDFCLENSLIICGIVIVYGMLLAAAHNNLERIAKKAKDLGEDELFNADRPEEILTAKNEEFWNELRSVSGFPFISHSTKFLLYRVNKKNMQKLLSRFIAYQQKNKPRPLKRKRSH
jgi:hypothetical protein